MKLRDEHYNPTNNLTIKMGNPFVMKKHLNKDGKNTSMIFSNQQKKRNKKTPYQPRTTKVLESSVIRSETEEVLEEPPNKVPAVDPSKEVFQRSHSSMLRH